jgi:hypothetical protein
LQFLREAVAWDLGFRSAAFIVLSFPCENRRSVKLGRQDAETPRELSRLFFEFCNMSHQLIFVG